MSIDLASVEKSLLTAANDPHLFRIFAIFSFQLAVMGKRGKNMIVNIKMHLRSSM
ncbi:hypothetical protein [Candidatus Steffania adelgidicola]|uniref:hypothetical protein n=1 Tax=Candidatus Steffania adelgidicola TaxID=1076626 RepID=UPI001D02558D|nr:hypothetical protein [Candidatus Steffania adelgidicola]